MFLGYIPLGIVLLIALIIIELRKLLKTRSTEKVGGTKYEKEFI